MFNATRLKIARQRNKITSKELAELIGVSPITITRIEKETNQPDIRTVEAIAAQLSYPIKFFYEDDINIISKETASFRSLKKMSAKERDAALAAGSLAQIFLNWADKEFNLPDIDLPDFSQHYTPEAAAREIREVWGVGELPIGNLINLLESKGVRIFSLAESTKNVDAFSLWSDNTPYVFLNTIKTAERSRFDAAHELGHLLLHKHGGTSGSKEVESEANAFASHFLMPDNDVRAAIPYFHSLDQLVKAKKRWKVSLAALGYRLRKMNKMTEWQYRTFCINVNKKFGTIEPNTIDREETIVWKMVFTELWKDGLTRDQIAEELNLPDHELENMFFGLLNANGNPAAKNGFRPKIELI